MATPTPPTPARLWCRERLSIDLYYETYEESVENAVIPVTVYVLDDETAARYKEQNDAILEADTVVGR